MLSSYMRFLITLFSMLFVVVTSKAATLSNVTVGGQAYDITYHNSVTFNAYETTIDDAPWWGNGTTAQTWANAANTNDLRFAFDSSTTNAFYYTNNGGLGFDAKSASANYAVSAVAVPAPLPILGILPVVGFLKRMRKRQRA